MQSFDEDVFLLRDEPEQDANEPELSQSESQKLAELQQLSQEYKDLDLELQMHKMDLSSDSDEDYNCITGVSESQRESIYKEAIYREAAKQSYSQMGRKDRDHHRSRWIASQFMDNQACSIMSQGSKDEEFIATYGFELFLEVQCEIFRQAIRNKNKRQKRLQDKAEEKYGLYTCLNELTDSQFYQLDKKRDPKIIQIHDKQSAINRQKDKIKAKLKNKNFQDEALPSWQQDLKPDKKVEVLPQSQLFDINKYSQSQSQEISIRIDSPDRLPPSAAPKVQAPKPARKTEIIPEITLSQLINQSPKRKSQIAYEQEKLVEQPESWKNKPWLKGIIPKPIQKASIDSNMVEQIEESDNDDSQNVHMAGTQTQTRRAKKQQQINSQKRRIKSSFAL